MHKKEQEVDAYPSWNFLSIVDSILSTQHKDICKTQYIYKTTLRQCLYDYSFRMTESILKHWIFFLSFNTDNSELGLDYFSQDICFGFRLTPIVLVTIPCSCSGVTIGKFKRHVWCQEFKPEGYKASILIFVIPLWPLVLYITNYSEISDFLNKTIFFLKEKYND